MVDTPSCGVIIGACPEAGGVMGLFALIPPTVGGHSPEETSMRFTRMMMLSVALGAGVGAAFLLESPMRRAPK